MSRATSRSFVTVLVSLVGLLVVVGTPIRGAARAARVDVTEVQAAALHLPGEPVRIDEASVVSTAAPAAVRYTVKNVSQKGISHARIALYAFNAAGRPLGFTAVNRTLGVAGFASRERTADVIAFRDTSLDAGAVAVVAVHDALYSDGSTWHAPPNIVELVKERSVTPIARTGTGSPDSGFRLLEPARAGAGAFVLAQRTDFCGFPNASAFCTAERHQCVDLCKVNGRNCVSSFSCNAHDCSSECKCDTTSAHCQ